MVIFTFFFFFFFWGGGGGGAYKQAARVSDCPASLGHWTGEGCNTNTKLSEKNSRWKIETGNWFPRMTGGDSNLYTTEKGLYTLRTPCTLKIIFVHSFFGAQKDF